jgi:pyrimidine-specific ribonucleoside hydrolase
MTVPLLIVCDPGIDDAVALFLACASPEVRLLGVTTVGGNAGLEHTTRNARRLLTLAGRPDVPVAAGAARPLVRSQPGRAAYVHGDDGVRGAELPEPAAAVDPRHAVELLADTVAGSAEPVTLVAVGPLTNVALFYALHPELAARLHRLVVMGGSIGAGNVTPGAEFNVWADPEAAYRVLTDPGLPRPVPTTLVVLEVTFAVPLDEAAVGRLAAGGAVGRAAAAMLGGAVEFYHRTHRTTSVPVHDAVAVVQVLRPELLRTQPCTVTVDCSDGPGRGGTTVDLQDGERWLCVTTEAQVEGVAELVVTRVADYER